MMHLPHRSGFAAALRALAALPLGAALVILLSAAPAAAQADPHAAPAAPAASPATGGHQPPADAQAPGHAAPAGLPAADPHAPADAGHAEAAHGDGHHEESLFSFLSRIANFLILAGGLFYLLRSPLGRFLAERAEQIKADLVEAARTRETASAELREIEARMQALPAEVDALKARGRQEVEAEQQRLRAATAAERERLLEQARREIDQQLQGARRALKQEVADLAVGIARLRVIHEITDDDRARLLERYVTQVKAAHE